MKRSLLTALAFGAMVSFPSVSVFAAAVASDSAANNSYVNTYNGQNFGTGFGAFSVTTTGTSGTFIGDSTANGGGSGGINTSSRSFGAYANASSSVTITRPFTPDVNSATILASGQTFTLSLDNGYITNGGTIGFNLQNTSGTTRLSFGFTGGNSNYIFFNGTSNINTGIGYTASGLTVAFTQGVGAAYTLTVTPSGGSTSTFTGSLAATGDISRFQVFSTNNDVGSDPGGSHDTFFNSPSITGAVAPVPEPATVFGGALLGLTGLVGVLRRWKR